MRQPAKENAEKIFELETSKFEECKKEPISFDQDSVKTGDIYFCLLSLLKCRHSRGRSGQPLEFCKKSNLKNFAILIEKHLLESLFNKVAGGLQLYQKETPTQVIVCQYCEICKITHFKKHL